MCACAVVSVRARACVLVSLCVWVRGCVGGWAGWSQEHTIQELVRKAGYAGRVTKDLVATIACTRYQSSKAGMTFHEYKARSAGV